MNENLSPSQTPTQVCCALTPRDRQTDTHAHAHPRFMARQHEGAQESQAAPWLAPPQLSSLAVTFLSPSLRAFSLLPGSLLFPCVRFSHCLSSLCWLSATSQSLPLCLSISSIVVSILHPPSPISLGVSICSASAALPPSHSPLPHCRPRASERWEGEKGAPNECLLWWGVWDHIVLRYRVQGGTGSQMTRTEAQPRGKSDMR